MGDILSQDEINALLSATEESYDGGYGDSYYAYRSSKEPRYEDTGNGILKLKKYNGDELISVPSTEEEMEAEMLASMEEVDCEELDPLAEKMLQMMESEVE
jgi:hypothetical protein